MAKHVVRNAEGEFAAAYDNLSEANSYIEASYPGATVSKPTGKKAQTLIVKDDEGKQVASIDIPEAKD